MDSEKLVKAFTQRFHDDVATGVAITLKAYLRLFPGAEQAISQAYDALMETATIVNELGDDATIVTGAPTTEPVPGFVGKTLGHYHILSEIGRGGQGLVFLARDERLTRQVALKVMNGMSMQSTESLQRFKREAEAVSRLDDPGICTVYETGTIDNVPYIAMQYVDGQSLSRILKDEKLSSHGEEETNLPGGQQAGSSESPSQFTRTDSRQRIEYYVSLIEKVARSLHSAHEDNLVHRDIKPGNIMVGKDGRPIILDFGLAHDDDAEEMGLTRTGDVLGTPAYMAPEQIRGDTHQVDRRTDIYALGVTLFECVTMQRPYSAPSRQALYHQIVEGRMPPASALVPAIRRDLDVILSTATDSDLSRRYQTAKDFADDLARFSDRKPIKARPASIGLRLSRWAERNPALALSLAALFIFLTAGLIATTSLWQQSEADRGLAEKATLRADKKTQESREHLASYRMLSDGNRYRHFNEEMASFYPPHPDRIKQINAWLTGVEDLVDRESLYQEEISRLRQNATQMGIKEIEASRHDANIAYLITIKKRRQELKDALQGTLSPHVRRAYVHSEETYEEIIGKLEATILANVKHVFEDPEQDWRHENLERLMRYMTVLKDKKTPLSPVASMLHLKDQCRRVHGESLVAYQEEWEDAIADISSTSNSPIYGGLQITPQLGLVPLGKDPKSGLWEFAHVLTGEIPKRRQDGALSLAPEFATVLVLLPGGASQIGVDKSPESPRFDPLAQDNELPATDLNLAPFFIGKFEYSLSQWDIGVGDVTRGVLGEDGVTKEMIDQSSKHPVTFASWENVNEFMTKLGFQLPTEAQWEYACRAGNDGPWSTGKKIADIVGYGNFLEQDANGAIWNDGFEDQAPVDEFAPNQFGLHQMMGNVWEYTCDGKQVDVGHFLPGDGLHSMAIAREFIIKGGSCRTSPLRGRTSSRAQIDRQSSSSSLGFRVARRILGPWSQE